MSTSAKKKRKRRGEKSSSRTRVRVPFTMKQRWWIALTMALLAMAVYAPSYDYDFVYDDDAVVKDNRFVHRGLEGLDEIWTTSYFQGFNERINARAYRPFPLTTFALQYELFELDPRAYHVGNLLFYGLTGVVLFFFLIRLLRKEHPFLAIAVCLLFLLHPIHTEVVANIKSRDTMLGFLGFAGGAYFLLRAVDRGNKWWLLPGLAFYFMGLFSKEDVITTTAVLPVMLWFFRSRMPLKKIAQHCAPYWAAALIFLVIRSAVIGGVNAGVTITYLDNSLLAATDPAQRVASNILVLGIYLWKTLFPHPLLSDYSFSTIPLVRFGDWRVWATIAAYAALLWVLVRGFRKRALYGFAVFYFLCTVSIYTSIVVTNVSAYNDRFLYTPVLGTCLGLGWLLSRLLKPAPAGLLPFLKANPLPLGLLSALLLAYVVKIETHLPVWKDRYVLFEHDVRLAPNNARLLKNNGGSLARLALRYEKSDPQASREYAEAAVRELEKALSIYPRISTGWVHLGNAYTLLKDYARAENAYNKALEIDPESRHALINLVNICYRTGRYEEAARRFEAMNPTTLTSNDYYLAFLVYSKLGRQDLAEEYRKRSGR